LLFVPVAVAVATQVTVRVEGKSKTLLASTVVQTHTGSITKGGTPPGKCPATSGAGALDVATHHHWNGTYTASIGDVFTTTILGETYTLKSTSFWEIFVDNKAASTGACEIKLHPHHDRLLFAAVPVSGIVYPTAINASSSAKVGHAFKVTVVWFNAKGAPKPLAGAHVNGGVTNSHGIIHIHPTAKGTLVLHASRTGYIRAAAVRVHVS
jgi:hypothetical protein